MREACSYGPFLPPNAVRIGRGETFKVVLVPPHIVDIIRRKSPSLSFQDVMKHASPTMAKLDPDDPLQAYEYCWHLLMALAKAKTEGLARDATCGENKKSTTQPLAPD